MKKVFVFILLSFILFSSCDFGGGERVKGNSNIQTQERPISSFSRVEVHGSMKVNVSQGDERKVMIEADENLIALIETIQDGNRLVIRSKEGYHLDPTGDMRVYITAPLYESIEVSGACDLIGQTRINNSEKMKLHVSGAGEIRMEVDAPEIEAHISGSGSVNLKGETKNFDLDLSGAANARCYELLAENTTVSISGAGDAEVYASVKLDAQVSGAGEVKYKGDAKEVKQNVSGAGSVNKR